MPFRDLDAYIKQARRANSDRELFSCSEAAARQLGLPWLAIVQSMAFFQPGGRYFRMDNFQSWGDVFVAEGYYRDDPALLAARSTSRAFCWHEMERLLGGFTRRQARSPFRLASPASRPDAVRSQRATGNCRHRISAGSRR